MRRLAWLLAAVGIAVGVVLVFVREEPPTPPAPAAGAEAVDARERLRQSLLLLGSRGERGLPDVPMLVVLLAHEDPATARLAAEALGRIGPVAAPIAERALMDAYAARADAAFRPVVEESLRAIGGWVRFRHEMPLEITFLGRPYLRVVAEAARRAWLKGDDVAVAERCWKQTLEHRRRLLSDRLFKSGVQTQAYVASTQPFVFEALWSPPFLLCASDGRGPGEEDVEGSSPRPLAELEKEGRRFDALLANAAQDVRSVYARFQREYGAKFDLRPLEDEYGGRPDYPPGVRSFADGFPIVFWVWTSPRAYAQAARARGERALPGEMLLYVLPVDDRPVVEVIANGDRPTLDPERAALAATSALLHSWRRQAANWRLGDDDAMAHEFWHGVSALFAGPGDPDGPRVFRAALRDQRAAARARGLAEVPWMPLGEFLRAGTVAHAADWLEIRGMPASTVHSLRNAQSFGFVRWLATSAEPERRAALEAGLKALLGSADPGPAVAKALGVRDEDDWLPIDAAFQTWMNAQRDVLGDDARKPNDADRPR